MYAPSRACAAGTSYERAKGETTEWEDILRAKGVLPPSKVCARILAPRFVGSGDGHGARRDAAHARTCCWRRRRARSTAACQCSCCLPNLQEEAEEVVRAAIDEARESAEAEYDPLAGKTVDELDELEVCAAAAQAVCSFAPCAPNDSLRLQAADTYARMNKVLLACTL
ncbi:hypothetical protein EON66_00300 [archaeon]|nr:MAG: hypothetical protein EON66_00300 [archaeon]